MQCLGGIHINIYIIPKFSDLVSKLNQVPLSNILFNLAVRYHERQPKQRATNNQPGTAPDSLLFNALPVVETIHSQAPS